MKSIILAAGRGSRIPEISKVKPKSLLKINRKSIISRQISYFKKLKINKIIIIRGYKKNLINFKSTTFIDNKKFKKNEQLDSLFFAKKELNENVIVVFSDIIYDFKVLKKIFEAKNGNIILGLDNNWKKRYEFRYDHPQEQADKVKLNKKKQVIKIGKRLKAEESHSEFLGMLKLTKIGCQIFRDNYSKIKKSKTKKMQIHDFLNFLIKKGVKINSTNINGKFMEIDTFNDFKLAKNMFKNS